MTLPPSFPPGLARLFVVIFAAGAVTANGVAADWPQWRGPAYDGISTETIPAALPAELPVLWRAKVGVGFATVSVKGTRLVTVGNEADVDTVRCLDAETGAVLWEHRYPCALDPRYYEGGPSATPTIHGDSVYTLSKKGHAFRFDLATGKVIWKRDLVADHGVELPEWSFASSPLIDGERVLLNVGRGGLALAAATGETRWLQGTGTSGYATLVPWPGNPTAATHVLFGARALLGIEAGTGRQVWEFPARASRDVNAADPIVRGNRVLLSSSSGTKLLEFAADGTPTTIWENRDLKWYFNAGVLIGDHLYSISGTTHRLTDLVCTRFDTGKTEWTVPGFRSGALSAAGATLVLLDAGKLTLFEASPEAYRPRFQQQVLEGKCWTVPVVAMGRIYGRNAVGDLVCLQLPAAGAAVTAVGDR